MPRAPPDWLSTAVRVFERVVPVLVPAVAIPKAGPSAGIAMATAMVSALSGRPARHDVAMTGEITLRGLVLPIGGLKEKTLAAKRAGIREVVVPKRNEKDLPEIPEEERDGLKWHFVSTIDEVMEVALGPTPARGGRKPTSSPAAAPKRKTRRRELTALRGKR